MRVTLSRMVEFRAMHRLHRGDWSEEENRARFGWTAAPPGHSHRYRCTVTVAGGADPPNGMVMDLATLDALLAEEVVTRFDGHHLNRDITGLQGVLPTCEALAREIFTRLAPRLPPGVALAAVRVAEDETLHAECTGDA
jgi:6-pyruvoyltetrahydropterin/6-carboxytetrahydropterin synthase